MSFAIAVVVPAVFTLFLGAVPSWPGPYSWQFLGLMLLVALGCGVRPGLLALALSTGAILWLGVLNPVHPGVELFVTMGLCLLLLLQRWRGTEAALSESLTETRRREEALRESTTLLRAISDASTDAIFAKDLHGRLRFANPATLTLVGKPPESVLGKTDVEIIDDREAALRVMENDRRVMASGVPTELEEVVPLPDGSQRVWLSLKLPYRDADGKVIGLLGISRDITDRQRSAAELRTAHERLQEEDRRKNEFIAVLSHELRNPLAPIRYALPLIEEAGLAGDAQRALDVIRRQTDHLTRLVDDLLDVSRISRGTIELRRERVALGSIITSAAEAASPAIAAARHELYLDIPDEEIWADADAARIAQVVTNLLNNAARYTQRGGRIDVSASREDGHAVIRVRDNGIGIPAGSLGDIFDMFHQVQRAPGSQHLGGLGVGLALARSLVALHGGSMHASSAGTGQGAEFVVRLPIVAPPPSGAALEPAPARESHRRLKVLVVDDNADLVEMLSMVVEGEGHDVRKALDGRSAIAAALSYRPDVVLLDLGLPLVSGIDVARELRRHDALASTRLVALTGWGQPEDRERTMEAGFDRHLTKPTHPQTLTDLLVEFAREADRADRG
jgi:two-component system CheB/CheR fusion protein